MEILTVAERQVLAELDRLGISQAGVNTVFTDMFEKNLLFLEGTLSVFWSICIRDPLARF